MEDGFRAIRTAELAIALELAAERPQRVVETRLDGPEPDVEQGRCLLERQPVEVVEDDDCLVLGW